VEREIALDLRLGIADQADADLERLPMPISLGAALLIRICRHRKAKQQAPYHHAR
jgi:hypothetical protein